MDADTISRVLAVHEISRDVFESDHPPEPIDVSVPFAYGGCTTGMIINAAHFSVPGSLHLYSLQGTFMGPAMIDRPLRLIVRRARDTRTFATRYVEASQILDDGTSRTCLVALADYMAQEKVESFKYSETPRREWGTPEQAKSLEEKGDEYVQKMMAPRKTIKAITDNSVTCMRRLLEVRFAPGAPFGDSMIAMLKHLPTVQDGLPLADKVSADWVRSRSKLSTESEQLAALAYLMDMATGFIAVGHNHQGLDDYGACSSLEFSLRFFSNKININNWHLREMSARVGAEGRSFHEIRLFNSQHDLVSILTQQAIIRPKPQKKSKM